MDNLTIDEMKEKLRPLLTDGKNLCIGSPNGAPIQMLNRYPQGDALFFDDKNYVYYALSQYGQSHLKNSWDTYFRFPYLYCSWHAWGKHTFKLVKRAKTLAEFKSFDEALTSLLSIRNETAGKHTFTLEMRGKVLAELGSFDEILFSLLSNRNEKED